MLRGSCLCGTVHLECEGPLEMMARCHCGQCRKASGAEFATNGAVASSSFRVVRGQELLGEYESSPGNFRVFCRACGSPLFKRSTSHPEQVRIRVGCLDDALDQRPLFHLHVASKPKWSEICDELPQLDEGLG